ncbi:MAG: histidinol-phosphatase HisJ family protein [Clostridia bacterium]|nr:histidinol-phosphatase HisJ family protein [Clostridia bacterium]
MYHFDSHVHTKYSFDGARDGSGEIDAIAQTAIDRGLNEISLCDHCDIDDILDGIYPAYPLADLQRELASAKERWAGKLRINFGIELGQPHARPEESRKLLAEGGFDFVIGSLHNLRGYPDFSFLKLERMPPEQIDYLIRRAISEQIEVAEFDAADGRVGVHTLAHITYIQRYMTLAGVEFDHRPYIDEFSRLLQTVIDRGIALEVNTSGLRRNSITMPGRELLELYRSLGGELITLGSDAHTARDVGANLDDAADMLRDIGFKWQAVVREGKIEAVAL